MRGLQVLTLIVTRIITAHAVIKHEVKGWFLCDQKCTKDQIFAHVLKRTTGNIGYTKDKIATVVCRVNRTYQTLRFQGAKPHRNLGVWIIICPQDQ